MSILQPQSWAGQNLPGGFVQDEFGFIFAVGPNMLVEQALVKLLRDNAEVAGIIGTKIYPAHLPQTLSYPAITYGLVNRNSAPVMDSATTTPPTSLYAFVSHAKGPLMNAYETAKLLDEAIRLCLQGYAGTVTIAAESVTIQGIFFVRSADDRYEDSVQVQRVGSAFEVRHSQPVP